RAENTLKNLIAETADSRIWDTSLVPTDTLDGAANAVSLQDALSAAMENRVELQETEILREINDIEQRYFRDQSRAKVDLVTSYAMTGQSGTPVNNEEASLFIRALGLQTPVPGFLDGGYGQSLSNLVQNRFASLRVGVQISLPLHDHEAEAKSGRAVVEGKRVNTQLEKYKQLIQMDVRNAYQAVNVAESEQQAASVARVAMEAQHASEQRRTNVGYSTNDVVLERQIELSAARLTEMRA